MSSRRRFLLQGSLAGTALLITRPFTSIANSLAPVTGYTIDNNKLVLAHTGSNINTKYPETIQDISKLQQHAGNLVMLHAGNAISENTIPQVYDASMHPGQHCSVAAGDYKVIYKGNIKTGIITANEQAGSIESINAIAVYLKKEKNCHLVICLSQLGYKSKTGIDDRTLAAGSTHLDVIIGGHAENFCTRPFIARNKNKEEVIINHAADKALALRKIEIEFDDRGKKRDIIFTKTILTAPVAKI